MTKTCSKCKTEKSVDCFNRASRSKDDFTGECKMCANARKRERLRRENIGVPKDIDPWNGYAPGLLDV